MPDWLDFRLTKIDAAFSEFPELKYLSLFYAALVILLAIFYMPFLNWAYDFNYFGAYPLQSLIAENVSWLVWGKCVIPPLIALFCYWHISDIHDDKHIKKYGRLPKWVR